MPGSVPRVGRPYRRSPTTPTPGRHMIRPGSTALFRNLPMSNRHHPVAESDRWRGLLLLLGLVLGSLLIAAIVAPLVYHGIRIWAEASPSRLATYLAAKDFPRYFDRLRWLMVLLGLPWLCRGTGLASREALGVLAPGGTLRRIAAWMAVGIATIAIITAGQVWAGVSTWAGHPGARAAEILVLGLASAAILGFVEELLFRGVIFRLFLRPFSPTLAVPIAAAFYSLMHFQRVSSDLWPDDAPVTMASGFVVAWGNVVNMITQVDPVLFLGLFLAGCSLSLLVLRTGDLWSSVGLHAGWVWGGFSRRLFDPIGVSPWWGGKAMIDGALPLLILALLAVALATAPRRRAGAAAGSVGE